VNLYYSPNVPDEMQFKAQVLIFISIDVKMPSNEKFCLGFRSWLVKPLYLTQSQEEKSSNSSPGPWNNINF